MTREEMEAEITQRKAVADALDAGDKGLLSLASQINLSSEDWAAYIRKRARILEARLSALKERSDETG